MVGPADKLIKTMTVADMKNYDSLHGAELDLSKNYKFELEMKTET